MSVSINSLDIKAGDHLFLYVGGNKENSIMVSVAPDGIAFVSGPFNTKSRTFRCEIPGWVEVSTEERQAAMNPAPHGGPEAKRQGCGREEK